MIRRNGSTSSINGGRPHDPGIDADTAGAEVSGATIKGPGDSLRFKRKRPRGGF
jgi:hypothetical protein